MIPWRGLAFAVSVGLACYDARLTQRRMRKYGILVETNPVIQNLATWFGNGGVWVGILVPTVAVCLFAMLAQSSLLSGVVLGARLCLFDFQLESLALEKAYDARLAQGGGTPPHLPETPND